MADEDKFVAEAQEVIHAAIKQPLSIERGFMLLYEVTLDNNLQVIGDPQHPAQGFKTDLCVFEKKSNGVTLPRVVIEFKTTVTTHDVITYSVKARKHKQVYPWLRYGFVASRETTVPKRFFVHNDGIDFFMAFKDKSPSGLEKILMEVLLKEVEVSRELERIAFDGLKPYVYRAGLHLTLVDGAVEL